MCGGSVSVDNNGIGVIMCLSDVWSEVVLDPLLDSVFIGFLGVVKIDVYAICKYVDNAIARLAFVVSQIVRVTDSIDGGLVREVR